MHPLTQKITTLQHRLALRERLVAACRITACVLAAALLLGLLDYVFRYTDRGLRIMATAAFVAAATAAVYRWWYLARRRRLVPLAVAQRVEARFPHLGDSLASAVEFLQQCEDDATAGSAQLRRHVITEVQTAVEGLPLDAVIDHRPLRRAAAWLAAVLLVFAALLAIDASAVGMALARLAVPFGASQWPRNNHLEFHDPPTRLAAGQTFEVELVDAAGQLPEQVWIEYRTSRDGRHERESAPMIRVGDVMVARRENVERSFAFRATGGDDDTMPWHDVEVVEPPRLESFDIVVHPPAYTGRKPAASERHLEVLEGSGIEVHGTASEALGAARVLLDGDEIITARIVPVTDGEDRRAFRVAPEEWKATKSGGYRLELTDVDGLAGVVGQWRLRVNPDTPPTVSWQSPSDDIFVTPAAVVPIELAVKDNLAVQKVELLMERRHVSGEAMAPDRIEIYHGPEKAGVDGNSAAINFAGESRIATHTLDIGAMNLAVGTQLMLQAEAMDYKPSVGRTAAPRRITLITPDDLEARLADRQSQIVRQLERALAAEQTTRDDVRRLEIQQRDAGTLTTGDRNTMQSADLNQRRVGRMLVDPVEGVPALVSALLAELEMNRLAASDTRATMRELSASLDRLAAEPLPTAERELTSARKAGEAMNGDANSDLLARSLAAAGAAQDTVIAELEQLLGELAGWADFRRFARQVAELRQEQLAHEKTSRAEIGLQTLPLDVRELSRSQRANVNKASAAQDALARRYEKIEQGMEALARQLVEKDTAASTTLTDAVELARRLAIGTNMHESARDLGENRVSVALDRETQIAADLQQVLDLLRNQSAARGQQLVDLLRNAQERLTAMREELAKLREQIERTEAQGTNASPRTLQALNERQNELRRQIEQLARELDRLQANAASRSTQSAASRLNHRAGLQNQAEQKPSSSNQVRQSEKDLEEAARQLAQRVQEAEFDIALELVRRFQTELQEMIARQKSVLNDTIALDQARQPHIKLTAQQSRKLADLVTAERELAGLAIEHSEVLAGLGAVRISLEEAAARLNGAADILAKEETGSTAQQAEERALRRLEGMMEAFAQTAAEAGRKPPAGNNVGNQNGQPRRPTFELLEIKMLRMLQVDLNERTQAFQERLAAPAGQPPNAAEQAAVHREAQELAAEQRRLAGLVQEMLSRNNKPQE